MFGDGGGSKLQGPHYGYDGNDRVEFYWETGSVASTKVTKNQNGATGWAKVTNRWPGGLLDRDGRLVKVHQCKFSPCACVWTASKWGMSEVPVHFAPVPPVAAAPEGGPSSSSAIAAVAANQLAVAAQGPAADQGPVAVAAAPVATSADDPASATLASGPETRDGADAAASSGVAAEHAEAAGAATACPAEGAAASAGGAGDISADATAHLASSAAAESAAQPAEASGGSCGGSGDICNILAEAGDGEGFRQLFGTELADEDDELFGPVRLGSPEQAKRKRDECELDSGPLGPAPTAAPLRARIAAEPSIAEEFHSLAAVAAGGAASEGEPSAVAADHVGEPPPPIKSTAVLDNILAVARSICGERNL